eukprot:472513-Hanusia_phi.AAC.2
MSMRGTVRWGGTDGWVDDLEDKGVRVHRQLIGMGGETSRPVRFNRVCAEDVEGSDPYWSTLLQHPPASFAAIPFDSIRSALKDRPRNLALLSRHAVAKLRKAAESTKSFPPMEQESILGAAALLSRLLPVLFEQEHEHKFIENVFWRGMLPPSSKSTTEEDPIDALALPLLQSCIALLFKPGFTCSSAEEKTTGWYGSLANSSTSGRSRQFDQARTEMLRLLLVCCSRILFITPEEYRKSENPFLSYLSTRPKEEASALFRSLTAVIFSYDPVGLGIPYSR